MAVAGLLGAVAVTGIVRIGGDGSVQRRAPTATAVPPTSTRGPLETDAVIRGVGNRPNHVALAGDNLFVTAFARDDLSVVDRGTGRVERTVRIGAGASEVAVDGGEVSVALTRAHSVVALDARTGRVRRRLTVRKPNSLAVNGRSIWVGSRTEVPGQPDELVRFDRRSGTEAQRFPISLGVFTLALSSDELWIGHRRGGRVTRLGLTTGKFRVLARDLGGGRVVDLATGRGYVWVCTEDGVIARVDPRTRAVDTMDAGGRAGRIALAGGRLWISLIDAGELASIDLATSRRTGENVPVGLSPYGVAADARAVFVTSRGESTVTRIDF